MSPYLPLFGKIKESFERTTGLTGVKRHCNCSGPSETEAANGGN
jgi:hypothetical protein